MKALGTSFVAGLLFALGLGIAGMTRADKVIAFLDLTDAWDPSLALVMAGAIAVHFVAYRVLPRLGRPVLAPEFRLPTRRDIEPRLVAGAALFGVGWGLGGYCPGPGLVAGASGAVAPLLFVVGLITGITLFRAIDDASRLRSDRSASSADTASSG